MTEKLSELEMVDLGAPRIHHESDHISNGWRKKIQGNFSQTGMLRDNAFHDASEIWRHLFLDISHVKISIRMSINND